MNSEEFLKRSEDIFEQMSCWNGLENEVIKLFCLFSRCVTNKHEGQEWVNINYVREKLFNLLIKHPILLSSDTARMYAAMRIEKELGEEFKQAADKINSEE